MAGSRLGLALLVALVAFAAAHDAKGSAVHRHTKVAVEDPAAAALAQAEDAIAKKDYAAAEELPSPRLDPTEPLKLSGMV